MAANRFVKKLMGSFGDNSSTITFSELDPFGDESAWITTGSPNIDYKLGTLGIPKGIIEVRGESQSGKTTFSLHVMKECLRQYGENACVVILSTENRDNKPYAKKIGLDIDSVIIHKCYTIEEVFNRISQTVTNAEEIINSELKEKLKDRGVQAKDYEKAFRELKEEEGKIRYLFVWDSLGQTASGQEVKKMQERSDKDTDGAAAMGSAARAISLGFRAINAMLGKLNITLLVINRGYDKIDGTPGKESYGGKAIKFSPSMRLELRKKLGIKVGEEEIGQITEVNVIKSDYGNPKQRFDFELMYGYGIVLSDADLKFGFEESYLEKYGALGAKFLGGRLQWMTRKALLKLYDEGDPLLKTLSLKLLRSAHAKVTKERLELLADDSDETDNLPVVKKMIKDIKKSPKKK